MDGEGVSERALSWEAKDEDIRFWGLVASQMGFLVPSLLWITISTCVRRLGEHWLSDSLA